MEKSCDICVFCAKKGGDLISFQENTLLKCKLILKIRKDNNLSFNRVVLPSVCGTFQCYHVPCYRKFTALGKKFRQVLQNETIFETSTTLQNSTTEAIEATLIQNAPSCSRISNEDTETAREDTTCEAETSDLLSGEDTADISIDIPTDKESNDLPHVEESSITVCIICDKVRKKHKGRWLPLHTSSNNSIAAKITKCATEGNDYTILQKIDDFLHANRIIAYHKICIVNFEYECGSSKPRQRTQYHDSRDCHKLAYDEVCSYIEQNTIAKNKCVLLSLLLTIYMNRLTDEYKKVSNIKPNHFHSNYLKSKLLETFKNKIQVIVHKNNQVIAPSEFSPSRIELDLLDDHDVIQKAAILLRTAILQIEAKKLPNNITVANLLEGECTIPPNLADFFTTLLSSTDSRRQNSPYRKRLAKSFAEDVIYAVSSGRIKTAKHVTLGMALKSMTSSRNVVNIINRFGHCCSYTTIEELETEATFVATSRSQISPDDIVRKPNLSTGLAFNNFDRFVDTLSGKDTLHDTVGIIFQDIVPDVFNDDNTEEEEEEAVEVLPKTKKRRTFDAVIPDLEPYAKRPKIQETLNPLSLDAHIAPISLKAQQRLNLTWMLTHALRISNTPMWVGFNNLIHLDESTKQKIAYLTTINLSPTNTAVVQETMIQCLKVAQECKEKYIQVTYDLAIAKVALQIQSTENPRFNNIFIHVGSFHVMMAYFKAIGKIIDNCGLPNIIIDSGLLASGSINGLISGKHFNRCKRLHPLISLAITILHFRRFLSDNQIEITDSIREYLENFIKKSSKVPVIDDASLLEIMEKYEEYRGQTINGEHGKTPQFYMIYANLIEHYLLFNASIRLADFELFKHMLPKITNLFFALNQPNYARWLVRYHNNLSNVDKTHPGLKQLLENGSFGIKRTNKAFSRQPIDLTLEQTINADAANKLTGILHFTNSISARQRWCKSHSIRSAITSNILQQTGLRKNQDITSDLEKNRIQKSTAQLNKLLEGIDQNLNPFDVSIDKQELFNIASGQAVSTSISDCLLNVEINGNKLRENFIFECLEDHQRFEKPIKQNKIMTFADAVKKKKITVHGKVQEIRLQRDLFGRLLAVSLEQQIDIEKVLSFPLTSVPLSLCHLDGSICKTNKSALLKCIENEVTNPVPPGQKDVILIDGFFFLHLMKDVPQTFGNISRQILQNIVKKKAIHIALIFDQYVTPSIKDNEHNLRNTCEKGDYHISGEQQSRPADFIKELRNTNFKQGFVNFLINHWRQPEMAPYFENKTVYIDFDYCYKFEVFEGVVIRRIDDTYTCSDHEEADTKIIHHVCHIDDYEAKVSIRCSDTDILVILLGNMMKLKSNLKIWMEVGVGNNLRNINVTQLYEKMGESLCAALPAFHAFTGCDFNPAFFRKGKKRPYNLLKSSISFQNAFINLSQMNDVNYQQISKEIEKFVCHLYGLKKIDNVDEARFILFNKAYAFKDTNDVFKIDTKNVDGSNLPPCKTELKKQVQRAAYISNIWSHADRKVPTTMIPVENGWQEINGRYQFDWYEGNQLPNFIGDVLIQPDTLPTDAESSTEKDDLIEEISDDLGGSSSEEDDGNSDFD